MKSKTPRFVWIPPAPWPAGIILIVISLALCGIMMMAMFCDRTGKHLPALHVAIALLLCLVLNLGSNLLRIVLLVQFRIPPETTMHEIIGVLCLVIYMLLPAGFFIRWLTRRFGRADRRHRAAAPLS